MGKDLSRLLSPKTITIFGGAWAANVIRQLKKSDFQGEIWPVHPKRDEIEGVKCFTSINSLPSPPDASFIGVNREATIEVVRELSAMGAGGATCFASGFLESEAESAGGADLQNDLIEAAGDMPIVGPNCYGLINYLDNVTLWPDEHGGVVVDKGVAIIVQSSNVAINMTMQRWGLPIAYVATVGNQAQTSISDLANALMKDERITAIGFYIEGFNDIAAFETMSAKARQLGKSIVALKAGKSEKSQIATMTHTASLAGSTTASSALLKRLGIVEVNSVGVFLETLKLLHMFSVLPNNEIASISCSGGEASLMADIGDEIGIHYRDISPKQSTVLKSVLGPIVTVANPLDYHTFVWGDVAKMSAVFEAVIADGFALTIFVLDLPRSDRCDPSGFGCAIEAIISAKQKAGGNVAVLTSLPEGLPEEIIAQLGEVGIATLHGMEIGLAAVERAVAAGAMIPSTSSVLVANEDLGETIMLNEAKSKSDLREYGLSVPKSVVGVSSKSILVNYSSVQFPLALKSLGIAHKSEAGAVKINIRDDTELQNALAEMPRDCDGYLLEEMVQNGVAEILIGITRDTTGLFLLTLGAGGILTELLDDTVSLLLPSTRTEIADAFSTLKISRLVAGYRGKPAGDLEALFDAIEAVCNYAQSSSAQLIELDINPYIVCEKGGAAVDALIVLRKE